MGGYIGNCEVLYVILLLCGFFKVLEETYAAIDTLSYSTILGSAQRYSFADQRELYIFWRLLKLIDWIPSIRPRIRLAFKSWRAKLLSEFRVQKSCPSGTWTDTTYIIFLIRLGTQMRKKVYENIYKLVKHKNVDTLAAFTSVKSYFQQHARSHSTTRPIHCFI